ncbi:MAG: hypothetical protein A2W05_09050 [Candidatus Schekmanbacteria bacterium RBG_16_38_10]|uniref:Ice-binding protein C-terminal domain-containing protein n=1 Tax=Candidatus Schekmanbacteria bacterium RBG_16_38_10 TaxID=1817879 RepID=A0A1F7RVI5_9BACT|nr:MAG: hypothetical protein A2W05_09050 [Candidatus Schekmanbacteria bacterium RBG_16_38_10]
MLKNLFIRENLKWKGVKRMRKILVFVLMMSIIVIAWSGADAGTIWGNSASFTGVDIEAFDSSTGALQKQFRGVSGNGRAIVVIGNTIYYTRTSDPNIYKMDATTGAAMGSILTTNASMSTLAWDGSTFWTADYSGTARAFQIDPNTGLNIKTITLGTGTFKDGLEYFFGKLIANRGDAVSPGNYDIYDLDGNLIDDAFITTGKSSTGIAYDGTDFYVSNIFDRTIDVFAGDTGSYLRTIDLTSGNPLSLPNPPGGRLIEDLSVDYAERPDTGGDVPEPATLLLLGSGLIGVGFARKRFIKNNQN